MMQPNMNARTCALVGGMIDTHSTTLPVQELHHESDEKHRTK